MPSNQACQLVARNRRNGLVLFYPVPDTKHAKHRLTHIPGIWPEQQQPILLVYVENYKSQWNWKLPYTECRSDSESSTNCLDFGYTIDLLYIISWRSRFTVQATVDCSNARSNCSVVLFAGPGHHTGRSRRGLCTGRYLSPLCRTL